MYRMNEWIQVTLPLLTWLQDDTSLLDILLDWPTPKLWLVLPPSQHSFLLIALSFWITMLWFFGFSDPTCLSWSLVLTTGAMYSSCSSVGGSTSWRTFPGHSWWLSHPIQSLLKHTGQYVLSRNYSQPKLGCYLKRKGSTWEFLFVNLFLTPYVWHRLLVLLCNHFYGYIPENVALAKFRN